MLEARLKDHARSLGFDLVGIAPATAADGFDHLKEWLDQGCAGEMQYMSRNAEARQHPSAIFADVRSVIMVGWSYAVRQDNDGSNEIVPLESIREAGTPQRVAANGRGGKVARYARGADYHDVLWGKLDLLLHWLQQESPGCRGRGVVDTAPLLERDFARRAGLGWFGKNTMLIDKRRGSYFFLGALLVDIELKADAPHSASHCGTCTACLDACPTQAFTAPGRLDARRCISYLTIELRSPIPEELRPGVGAWLFGCDVCQEVCPWNSKTDVETIALDPVELLGLSDEQFRRRFRDTAIWRTKRRGLLRNAALVLGNTGDHSALPALRKALDDLEPLIREAASWAIAQILNRVECGG